MRRVLEHGMTALKTCVRSENGEDDAVCGSRRRGLAEVHQAGLGLAQGLPHQLWVHLEHIVGRNIYQISDVAGDIPLKCYRAG